jgi:4-amino-4-deoxy-L-arabinose transferase-like glycosyltransferase
MSLTGPHPSSRRGARARGWHALTALPTGGRRPYAALAIASLLPRLVVVAVERSDIILDAAIVENNVFLAKTFASGGAFGYAPGVPSAMTQPLYGFFLIPLYWSTDGGWLSIGLAQAALALGTALLVYGLARRLLSPGWALGAAMVSTLNPYLVWHDVHVEREVLTELIAASVVLMTLMAVERRSFARAAALGVVTGLAILAEVRLVVLPLIIAGFLLWRVAPRRRAWKAALSIVFLSAMVVSPWVLRNDRAVGCATLTTNSQALWKANNPATYAVLARGGWIDDVPLVTPPRPVGGECGEMRFYRRRVLGFWLDHPTQKARLAGQAVAMLWDPRARVYGAGRIAGGEVRPVSPQVDFARKWVQGAFMLLVFALAPLGVSRVRRDFVVLAAALLAYQTLMAMVFAGTTRYRAPWDFLLVVLAAAGLQAMVGRWRKRTPGTLRSALDGGS